MVTALSANAVLKGSQNAPTVARGIWPAGTQNSQSIQIANIERELSNATTETSAMLNAGLQLLMSDMPSFVDFASTGMFSGSEPLSLPSQVDGLDIALRTYVVSGAMVANGWRAGVEVSVTKEDIASPEDQGWDCEWHGPNNDFCGKWVWYSENMENAFTLTNTRDPTNDPNQTMNLLETILEKQWSTMPLLFEGAYNCTRAGNNGTLPVHISTDGILDMSCMSQLEIALPPGMPLLSSSEDLSSQ